MRSIIPCCVSTCKKNNILLHRFPNPTKHFPRFQIWLEKIDNTELFLMDPVTVYSNRRVCHQHFEHIYFSEGSKRLHLNAIPTLKLSGNRVNLISNHVMKAGEAEKQEKNVTNMTARSTICNEQEKYRDNAKDMGVLNDHNYVLIGKETEDMEYNSEVTVNTTLSSIADDDMEVLNDHNYALMGKETEDMEYNSEVTVNTTLPSIADDDQGPKNILRLCEIGRKDLTPKKKKLYTQAIIQKV